LLLLASLLPLAGMAQLNNGGLNAMFGIDADTRSNYMKFGPFPGAVLSDDWFSPSGSGNNVIDTSSASTYLSLLQSGANIIFSKRMSQLLYAKVNGKLWLDAAYGRDYVAAQSLKDTTTFTIAAKNGDNPNVWQGGLASTPTKNDLVDVYAHMRRDGLTVYDSLWFMTGITAYGNAANSYYDVELYRNSFGFNPASGTFSSAGTSGGHTEWLFDAAGNVIQTGDLIVAVSFSPGSVPVIDVRIWVSQTTYNNYYGGALAPKYFNFNASYSSTSGSYGYASIVSKTGTTAFGSGVANYSGTPAQDTTYATPWGTANNGSGWTPQYQSEQFIEVGLNMTRIGVDPALYSTLNPCQSMFSNIFFKSRSSSSFTANLQDFVAPLTFLRPPVMDFGVTTDTLRCNHSTATITLTNNTTAGYYTWKPISGGTISGANSDSSQLNVNQAGKYIVSASPAQGCPATQVDTIVVPVDTSKPVASAAVGLISNTLYLYGGNAAASNYSTPFGGSQGLTWNWTGPGSFASGIQNPTNDTVWGTYNLTVTEKRNGCTATASTTVSAAMFTILETQELQLRGNYSGHAVVLDWQDANQDLALFYVLERSDGTTAFEPIATIWNSNISSAGSFSYTDPQPMPGNNLYRVKAVTAAGSVYYSGVTTVSAASSEKLSVNIGGISPQSLSLIVTTNKECRGLLTEYTILGQTLNRQEVSFSKGSNTISIPVRQTGSLQVFALFIDNRMVWSQKIFLR